MPIFDSFSKIFASLSPHRPRHRQADDRQSLRTRTQHRHSPSYDRNRSLAQSREVSPSSSQGDFTTNQQNQFSLLSEDEDDQDNRLQESPRDTAALPQVC
jgi:hypothetical protein